MEFIQSLNWYCAWTLIIGLLLSGERGADVAMMLIWVQNRVKLHINCLL